MSNIKEGDSLALQAQYLATKHPIRTLITAGVLGVALHGALEQVKQPNAFQLSDFTPEAFIESSIYNEAQIRYLIRQVTGLESLNDAHIIFSLGGDSFAHFILDSNRITGSSYEESNGNINQLQTYVEFRRPIRGSALSYSFTSNSEVSTLTVPDNAAPTIEHLAQAREITFLNIKNENKPLLNFRWKPFSGESKEAIYVMDRPEGIVIEAISKNSTWPDDLPTVYLTDTLAPHIAHSIIPMWKQVVDHFPQQTSVEELNKSVLEIGKSYSTLSQEDISHVIWDPKNKKYMELPEYTDAHFRILGNSVEENMESAKIIFFGEVHSNRENDIDISQVISTLANDGDIVLVEGINANTTTDSQTVFDQTGLMLINELGDNFLDEAVTFIGWDSPELIAEGRPYLELLFDVEEELKKETDPNIRTQLEITREILFNQAREILVLNRNDSLIQTIETIQETHEGKKIFVIAGENHYNDDPRLATFFSQHSYIALGTRD